MRRFLIFLSIFIIATTMIACSDSSINDDGDLGFDFDWQVAPNAPSKLSAIEDEGYILLSWEDEQEGIRGYYIYRSYEEDKIGLPLTDSLISQKSYKDSIGELESGQSYYYTVRAYSDSLLAGRPSEQIRAELK